MDDSAIEAYWANLQARIERVGYTFVGVFDPEGKQPPFAYSIGLTARGWPEVLLIGNLHPAVIEILLTDLIERWKANGSPVMGDNPDLIAFPDGTSHAMRVLEVPTELAITEYACQVPAVYLSHELKVVQVLWPDKAGKFPGEEGYDAKRMVQPVVGK